MSRKDEYELVKQQLLRAKMVATETVLVSSSVPSKRSTKGRTYITKGSSAAYGAETFRECPGGRGVVGMIRAIASERTGCRTADAFEKERLKNSARNANTTSRSHTMYYR